MRDTLDQQRPRSAWASTQTGHLYILSRNVRKRTFRTCASSKIQISLRIRAVWSKSSMDAFSTAKDAMFLHAYNEESDQTVRMRRLIRVFVGRTFQNVRFLILPCFYWGKISGWLVFFGRTCQKIRSLTLRLFNWLKASTLAQAETNLQALHMPWMRFYWCRGLLTPTKLNDNL